MVRTLLVLAWMLVLVGVGIWHFGPGQDFRLLDDVSSVLARADRLAATGEWAEAVQEYDEALRLLPPGKIATIRGVRLERAKAQMMAHQLPEANQDLKALVDEIQADAAASPTLLAEARSALAQSQYYMTWLMRLEGEPRDLWEPEIEACRQTYRLLAEDAGSKGDTAAAKKIGEDLESAVRLARMDLGDLQGLPLPCQCQGCKSCKNPGRCQSKSAKKGQKEPKDARGASSGPPPDDGGH
jgi:tetratricopeptide (TPR) repeat protein